MLVEMGLDMVEVVDENEMRLRQGISGTVSPARTFLEKAFLLAEEFMKDRPRTNRMSRHLYDIEKLSHTKYMSMALADHDLYMQIVRHRKKYYHLGYVDYDKILPDTIDFVPPVRVIDSFRSDYNEMTGSFIYEESSLDFDSLLQRIAAIRELFRKQ